MLAVLLGAMVGAPVRYLVSRALPMPWGTFAVNAVGSFILGLVMASPVYPLVGVGFCGALTTYSTFSYETLQLVERRAYKLAVGNAVLSVVVGLGAAALGYVLG